MEKKPGGKGNAKRRGDDRSGGNHAEKCPKSSKNISDRNDDTSSCVNVQGAACGSAGGPGSGSATGMFSGIKVFILETGIGKTRRDLFGKQVKKNGGDVVDKYAGESSCTHIVCDEKVDLERLCKILKVDDVPTSVISVKSTWLSSCLKEKKLIPVEGHEIESHRTERRSVSKSKLQNVAKTGDSEPNIGKSAPGRKDQIPFRFSTGFGGSDGGPKGTEIEKKESKVDSAGAESTFEQLLQTPPDFIGDNTDDSAASEEEFDDRPVAKVESRPRKKQKTDDSDPESDYVPSDDEGEPSGSSANATPNTSPLKNFPTDSWVCSMSSKRAHNVNHNEHLTAKLEQMATLYQNTNDRWRAFSYSKAVAALKRHPKPITTWEEAKALPGVGAKLADKIKEIIESGELRKLNELSSREDVASLNLFMNIWGAGPTTARQWVQMGLKTLDDVREKVKLTKQQKIGLAHYDDFLDRMPREEAAEIEAKVKEACHELDPGLLAHACGSYRRGKTTCGDVDILVTHPDGKSHKGVFGKLLTKLKDEGFLTDDLVSAELVGNQKKYLGVCKLPGETRRYRRLDIIVVPYDEYACALVYFTGSAHFNRSLRHLAKKNNMSLNEHALCVGVVRKGGEKIHKGTPIPTPTEESIFKHFGLKYRPPEERDH